MLSFNLKRKHRSASCVPGRRTWNRRSSCRVPWLQPAQQQEMFLRSGREHAAPGHAWHVGACALARRPAPAWAAISSASTAMHLYTCGRDMPSSDRELTCLCRVHAEQRACLHSLQTIYACAAYSPHQKLQEDWELPGPQHLTCSSARALTQQAGTFPPVARSIREPLIRRDCFATCRAGEIRRTSSDALVSPNIERILPVITKALFIAV